MTPIDRLSLLDSCTVSDATDALGLPCSESGMRRQSGSGSLIGQTITVQLTEGTAPENAPKVHLCATAVSLGGPNSVIVISHPGIDAGGWGGVLTRAAIENQIAGVILDGATRDVDEARTLDFPIFARTTTARTARGRLYESATNIPITIGNARIEPGDYVISDDSGTVFISQDNIEKVLEKAETIVAKETEMVRLLQKGVCVTEVLGANYEEMLKR